MTKFRNLYEDYGQSPWLDNLTRTHLRDGTLARMVAADIHGVTANASPRWERPSALGAHVQRPLWASTFTTDSSYPDALYVDSLIGPNTENILSEKTIHAFEDHGTLARTIDTSVDQANQLMDRLGTIGIDIDAVGLTLEERGVAGFNESFVGVLDALDSKAQQLASS